MNYQQLLEKIFADFDNAHYDILCDVMMTSKQHAEKILDKYDTSKLTKEQFDQLKQLIVDREVGEFLEFVERHKDVLDSDMTDGEKFRVLFERCDNPYLTEKERTLLKKRIRRHIYDNEVCKILSKLVDDLGLGKKKQ